MPALFSHFIIQAALEEQVISPFKSYAGTLTGCSFTSITKNLQLDHATTSNGEISDNPSLQGMNDTNEKNLRKCPPFQ